MRALAIAVLIGSGCAAHPPRPLPPPAVRVAEAMSRWGDALRRQDAAALARAEDRDGRFAIAYAASKVAAGHVEGGPEAVELTVFGTVLAMLLSSLWPGAFGELDNTVVLAVPTGALGPALIEAGLVERPVPGQPALAVVALPMDQTLGRVEAAQARHRDRLRARAAWTCRPIAIERTIDPAEPSLQRGARASTHIFAGWLAAVDAAWLVRADCGRGPGLFLITGHVERGLARDQVLAAAVP